VGDDSGTREVSQTSDAAVAEGRRISRELAVGGGRPAMRAE